MRTLHEGNNKIKGTTQEKHVNIMTVITVVSLSINLSMGEYYYYY